MIIILVVIENTVFTGGKPNDNTATDDFRY